MLLLVCRRIGLGILTIWVVSILVFVGTDILPGDVAEAVLGQYATQEALASLREQLGLDRPVLVRYFDWLTQLMAGDMGKSLANGRPVADLVGNRFANTMILAGLTAAFAVPLSIALGLTAAMFPGSVWDRAVSSGTMLLVAVPEFFLASLFVLIFAVWLGILPARASVFDHDSFWSLLHSLALPILTLTAAVAAQMARMTRAAILNVLSSPYIEMAILKGIPRKRIILQHALYNAVGPIANVIAINLAHLVSGVVIIETIFSYPGLAKMIAESVAVRDMPVIQACAMIFGSIYIGLILIADIVAIISNPRVRISK